MPDLGDDHQQVPETTRRQVGGPGTPRRPGTWPGGTRVAITLRNKTRRRARPPRAPQVPPSLSRRGRMRHVPATGAIGKTQGTGRPRGALAAPPFPKSQGDPHCRDNKRAPRADPTTPGGRRSRRGGAPREPSPSPPSACGVCPAGPLPGPAPRPPPLSSRLTQNALSCSPRQTGEGPSRPDGTPGGLWSIHTPPGGLGGPGAERTALSARLQPTQVTVNRELSKTRADHGDLRILRMRTPPNTMWGPVNAS